MAARPDRNPQIVAMGGGGFSEEPDNPLLDDFVLGLARKEIPRICFLPTASGDAQGYVEKFHSHFPAERTAASHLSLFHRCDVTDPEAHLLGQDVIYVGGGNTANMLAVWRVHGIDRILREAWESGVILAGISAGMNCWFEESMTFSFGGVPAPLKDGLGLVGDSACPHFDGDKEYGDAYRQLVGQGRLAPGVAADNGVALHFVGAELAEAVSSRPAARAYTVALEDGGVVERPMETRYLGE